MNARTPKVEPVHIDLDAPLWPQVASAIGEEAAVGLSRRLGGRRVYIPRAAGLNHPLS